MGVGTLVRLHGQRLLLAKRKVDQDRGALPGRAGDGHLSAQGRDPVREPGEPRTLPDDCATDAVIAHRHVQLADSGSRLDVHSGRLCVLGGVGKCLGHHVVRRDLDMLGQPGRDLQVELHRDDRPTGERLERRLQATLGQNRRVDTAGCFSQLLKRTG
jgi:hypothetical protein